MSKMVVVAMVGIGLLVGCGQLKQAQFAGVEPSCAQNPEPCKEACHWRGTASAECQVATVRVVEDLVRQGNTGQFQSASLQQLRAQLAQVCTAGIERACAADQELGAMLAKVAAEAQAAQKVADQQRKEHDEQQAKDQAEEALVKVAMDACDAKPGDCKAKCDTDPVYCVAWSSRLRAAKPSKLAEAKTYLKKACDGGVQAGCRAITDLDREEHQAIVDRDRARQQAAAESEQQWVAIVAAGDKIIETNNQADHLLGTLPTVQHQEQLRAAVARMRRYVVAVVNEAYCPAKGEFVRAAGGAEFAKRATEHCANDAPKHDDAALTVQCKAVYATACPAPPPKRVPPVADDVNSSPAWRAVQEFGDHLAQFRFGIVAAFRQEPSAQNARNAQIAPSLEARQIASDYCPAKKAFLGQFTQAQFRKAAQDHCGGDPPTARGVSGADVPLPTECAAIFATPCP